MGGHSKKSGRGGGRVGGNAHREDPLQRKKLRRDPGIPDLKKVSENLSRTARHKTHSVMSLQQTGGGPRQGLFGQNQKLSKHVTRAAPTPTAARSYSEAPLTEEELASQRRGEMSALALRTAEREHQYTTPLDLAQAPTVGQGYSEGGGEYGSEFLSVGDVDRRDQDRSLRRFIKEFNKVVESCDVLLQVLDARDPLGCRLTQLEQSIRSSYGEEKKQIVVVLNKADLLPSKEVLDAWVYYFEQNEHIMCIPFSATSKSQQQYYVGNLFKRLRSLARSEETGERKAIVVGVIGYPNVGKSSVINSLKRKNVVGVGNRPGFTTGNTEVELRSDIRVMDCPGVVSPGEDQGDVVLRNAVNVHELVNPFLPVQRLLQRCVATANADHLSSHNEDYEQQQLYAQYGVHPLSLYYQIPTFDPNNVMEFIYHVGVRRGRLRKGGDVDEEGTARMILTDWNDGRIGYYTLPPVVDDFFRSDRFKVGTRAEEDEEYQSPQLLTEMSAGLTVDGLPTFHLFMNEVENGYSSKKKKWAS